MDFSPPMLAHPQRTFRPCKAGVATVARRRDRRKYAAGLRIDLLDAILGDLEQVLPVEGRARMGGDIDGTHRLTALGVERIQFVAGGKPDVMAVERHAMHLLGTGKGTIFAENFG
ncbi:hypothetical protein D3C86_1932240 [compost metagenome]